MAEGPTNITGPWKWTPWLALVWLGGAAAMLARAGSLVVAAEKLRRRSGRPLADEAVLKLIAEAQSRLGLARRVRVVVTERLTSPAVMGWMLPVLILPLTMVTTLPMAQLQLILLHELAHVRRGDYLVNLCQLLVESLLFFNPAVWWISRQIRQEREACCDATAIALAGRPLQYAQTLAQVAGGALTAAPAFGDGRNPSGLKDRIQRLLVPGYRPALRLTWTALLAAVFVGGGLLFFSALGTRAAVAAILSPQERIDRIENKMAELGQPSVPANISGPVSVTFHVRMADGSPLPKNRIVMIRSINPRSSGIYPGRVAQDGWSTNNSVGPGQILVQAEADGYAPALAGPFDGRFTNHIEAGELVLDLGFEISLHVSDADTGLAVTNAALHTQLYMRYGGQGFQGSRDLRPDAAGQVMLPLCIDQPLVVTVNAPGYELIDHRFAGLSAGQTLELKLKSGKSIAGRVVDKTTGEGIPGATFRIIHEKKSPGDDMQYQWTDPLRLLLLRTDADGRFTVNQLRHDARSWLGVSAPGHESALLDASAADGKEATIRLGPELIVHGRVIGDPNGRQPIEGDRAFQWGFADLIDGASWGFSDWLWLHVTNGIATFQFTNHVAGPVTVSGEGYREEREVTAPIADWVVDLAGSHKVEEKVAPKREVVFRFKHPSGVPPRGTVTATVTVPYPAEKNSFTQNEVALEITNGEARTEIPVGARIGVDSKHVVGYWFKGGVWSWFEVTNGAGPLVVEIPLVPAGVIYAKARNADGTPAGRVLFGVNELKRAPGLDPLAALDNSDGMSDGAPRTFVSGPLPLGGTYQVGAWRGNSFCVSQPVSLTGEKPDAEIELQFPPGKTFEGLLLDTDGQPLRNFEMSAAFNLRNNFSFGLNSVFTDERGRFRIEEATPETGVYSVEADAPGVMTERVKLDFSSQPQTIRLKHGRTLAGRVVEAGTGHAVPDVQVSASDLDRFELPMVKTLSDANGRFEFTTLADATYTLYVAGGQTVKKFRANGNTNVVLTVKLN